MIIVRPLYIDKIKKLIDLDFIKVITGVRRAGKTYVLKQVEQELLERGAKRKQIIYMSFEGNEYRHLLDDTLLYQYLLDKIPNKKEKVYFLFDEIQEVNNWEIFINGLRVDFKSDIYVTGSNASLLSGELASYITGRYIEIMVYPLSFQEFLDFKRDASFKNVVQYYNEYRKFGGFPSVVLANDEQLKHDILKGIYDGIVFRDIVMRYQVRDPDLLTKLSEYLFGAIGQLTSSNSIRGILLSEKRKEPSEEKTSISVNTIDNYIKFLESSFMFYKTKRYDIRGKERLKSLGKYYSVDLGLRNNSLNKLNDDLGSQLENIVYLELLRRGYTVFVGNYNGKEIDFVASKNEEVVYIQVALEIPRSNNREAENLLYLPTGYSKKIIVEHMPDNKMIDGVPVVPILEFLLEGYHNRDNLI